jgi:hypothetical protein
VHLVILAGLAGLIVAPPLSRALGGQELAYLVIFTAVAVGAGWLLSRYTNARSFIRWAAFAPLLFLFAFLFMSPVNDLLGGAQAAGDTTVESETPVVFLLFDQLPMSFLLNEGGEIDSERFPGFARLAETSTFFERTSALFGGTEKSVPSLLSGQIPEWDALPVISNYPDNLFTILEGTYDIKADEYVTQMCPDAACLPPADSPSSFWKDSAIVTTRALLDEATADRFVPAIDGRWNAFGESGPETPAVANEARSREEIKEDRRAEDEDRDRFRRFLGDIGEPAAGESPGLDYIHLFQPHEPLRYLPSGQSYSPGGPFELDGDGWPDNQPMLDQRLQAYEAQVLNADRQVGLLLDRMEETGVLDESLLVVTSDHGMVQWAGTPNKGLAANLAPEVLSEVVSVPLFIKAPGQSEPVVDPRPTQLIDVLPTILDHLGADVESMEFDGQSMKGDAPQRPTLMLTEGATVELDFTPSVLQSRTVEWRHSLMPVPGDPFRFGPVVDLVGKPVPTTTGNSRVTASLEALTEFEAVDPDGDYVPAGINGVAVGADSPLDVAVGLNGAIAGGGRLFEHEGQWHLALLADPQYFVPGRNEVQLFEITAGGLDQIKVS